MIYGAIGYSILNNSTIFQNNEIILLADSHDEKYTKCDPNNFYGIDIQINDFLQSLLDKNYILMIEEIPNTKDLISLFPDSSHVKNIRDFYLKNQNNKNLIPIDVRFEIIDNYEEKFYDEQILINYIYKIYKFFMLEHDFFIGLNLYSKNIDTSILKEYYTNLLTDFNIFIKQNKSNLYNKIKNIINKDIVIDKINDILSSIMELYVMMRLFDIFIKNNIQNKKIVIYTGLYHTDNIKKLLNKYYKFTEIKNDGITEMKDIYKYIRDCININI
jgi:hypothetical protein